MAVATSAESIARTAIETYLEYLRTMEPAFAKRAVLTAAREYDDHYRDVVGAVRVIVEDESSGEKDSAQVANDYIIVCAGSCYVSHQNVYPKSGTVQLTIKGRKT